MLNSIQSYVGSREFACQFQFDQAQSAPVECPPRYKFNQAECIGNAFLMPMAKVFQKFNETNSYLIKVAVVIAGIFAAVIGIVGAVIKKGGEYANPHAAIRQQALAKLREVVQKGEEVIGSRICNESDIPWAMLMNMSDSMKIRLEGVKVDQLFVDRILKGKKGATDEDVALIGAPNGGICGVLSGFLGTLSRVSQSEEQRSTQQERLQTIRPVFDDWKKAWTEVASKFRRLEDNVTDEEQILAALTADDQETQQETLKYLKKLATKVKNKAEYLVLGNQYAQLMNKFV